MKSQIVVFVLLVTALGVSSRPLPKPQENTHLTNAAEVIEEFCNNVEPGQCEANGIGDDDDGGGIGVGGCEEDGSCDEGGGSCEEDGSCDCDQDGSCDGGLPPCFPDLPCPPWGDFPPIDEPPPEYPWPPPNVPIDPPSAPPLLPFDPDPPAGES